MYVISRKLDEKIIIDGNITITIIDISGERVRLGIKADKYVSIYRAEIWEQIQKAEPVFGETKPSKEPESRGV